MAVAYQGVPGAFSHEACREALPDRPAEAFDSFAAAIEAVHDGRCEFALLPVENSTAGPVPEVARLLPESGLRIQGEHTLRIRLQLLACRGATLETLQTAESHHMALAQCRKALAELSLSPVEVFDTAGAARAIAEAADTTRAAVASRTAGELYGLWVLREDIEDTADNRTRFVLLSRG